MSLRRRRAQLPPPPPRGDGARAAARAAGVTAAGVGDGSGPRHREGCGELWGAPPVPTCRSLVRGVPKGKTAGDVAQHLPPEQGLGARSHRKAHSGHRAPRTDARIRPLHSPPAPTPPARAGGTSPFPMQCPESGRRGSGGEAPAPHWKSPASTILTATRDPWTSDLSCSAPSSSNTHNQIDTAICSNLL